MRALASRGDVLVATSDTDITLHLPALRRFAFALTGDPAEADDLVQESLTRVISHRLRLGGVRNLRSYLFRVARNAHIDNAKRQRSADIVPLDRVAATLQTAPTQSEHMEMRELEEALTRLPEEQRQVILLVAYEGVSYRDAANILDVPIGTIMSRLSRGREALRSRLNRPAVVYLKKAQ